MKAECKSASCPSCCADTQINNISISVKIKRTCFVSEKHIKTLCSESKTSPFFNDHNYCLLTNIFHWFCDKSVCFLFLCCLEYKFNQWYKYILLDFKPLSWYFMYSYLLRSLDRIMWMHLCAFSKLENI